MRVDPMTLRYVEEKLADACDALQEDASAEALASAAESFSRLEPRDFPPDLRIESARIRERITAAGSLDETAERMSPESRREIADAIIALHSVIEHRLEEEFNDET